MIVVLIFCDQELTFKFKVDGIQTLGSASSFMSVDERVSQSVILYNFILYKQMQNKPHYLKYLIGSDLCRLWSQLCALWSSPPTRLQRPSWLTVTCPWALGRGPTHHQHTTRLGTPTHSGAPTPSRRLLKGYTSLNSLTLSNNNNMIWILNYE